MSTLERRLLLLKRKRAILRARTDLLAFTRYLMPSPDNGDDADITLYETSRHHQVIAAALEEVEKGNIPRLIITVPPRHGKTLLASRMFPAWYVGRHPLHHAIFATYSEKFAWDGGRAVRDLLQSPLYAHVFPGVRAKDDAASMDRVELENGGVLYFLGRRGGTTGRGGHIILIDDPFKDRQEADSPTIRERVWTWFTQVINSRLMTDEGRIVIIATRWHEDDLTGRITDPMSPYFSKREARKWRIIDLPALAEDDDILKRKAGEALWPARFSRKFLEEQRGLDPRGFEALYQGHPTPADGNFFAAHQIQTYNKMRDMPPIDQMRFYAASDHAVSTKQGRDSTCLVVVGVDTAGTLWVMPDLYWERAATDQVVEAMLRLMKKYKPLFWWAEKGHISKSIGPFLRKRMLETNTFVAVDEITPIGDKQTRAQGIHARMAMSRVKFPSFAPWWSKAQDQLLKFPLGAHDDFVDALAYIGLALDKQFMPKRKRQELKAPEVGSVAWLKGETKAQNKARKREVTIEGW